MKSRQGVGGKPSVWLLALLLMLTISQIIQPVLSCTGNCGCSDNGSLSCSISDIGLTTSTVLPDIVYTAYQTSGSTYTITPSYSQSYNNYCIVRAKLLLYDDSTNDWIDISSSGTWASYAPFITSFNTASTISRSDRNCNYWHNGNCHYHYRACYDFTNTQGVGVTTYNYETLAMTTKYGVPNKVFNLRIRIYNEYGYNDSTEVVTGQYLDYDFDFDLRSQCYENQISFNNASEQDDIAFELQYQMTASGPDNQRSQNEALGNKDKSICPLTRSAEIWDVNQGAWLPFYNSEYEWGSTYVNSGVNRIYFIVNTNDRTLDDANVLETKFQVRTKVIDPLSMHALGVLYQYSDVVFNSECDDDTFTQSTQLGLQTFVLGQGLTTVNNNIVHSNANCPMTFGLYEWIDSTQSWDQVVCDGSHPYIDDCTVSSLDIGNLAAATNTLYTPNGVVTLKWRMESTLSELADDDRIFEDEFQILFEHPCVDNAMVLSADLPLATYQVAVDSSMTFTPSYTNPGSCTLLATCDIFNESLQTWESCTQAVTYPFYSSFSTTTGAYVINWTESNFKTKYSGVAPVYPVFSYTVRIRVEDTISINANNFIEDSFTLIIVYDCQFDEITSSNDINELKLYISGTAVSDQIPWSQTVAGCPVVYALYFWNTDQQIWNEYSTDTHSAIVQSFASAGTATFYTTDFATYDMYPYFTQLAKIRVTSTESLMIDEGLNFAEDQFVLEIINECRHIEIQQYPIMITGYTYGAAASPYLIDFWELVDISVTPPIYNLDGSAVNPSDSLQCRQTTTLHLSNGDRTPVSTTYWSIDDVGYPGLLKIQWDPSAGTYDDYFVLQTTIYSFRTNEVYDLLEAVVYVKIIDPCPLSVLSEGSNSLTRVPRATDYWIIDEGNSQQDFSPWLDTPTTDYANQLTSNGYLWDTPTADLCGSKTYTILDSSYSTAGVPNYLTINDITSVIELKVRSDDPADYTNADVQYYIQGKLNNYYDDYEDYDTTANTDVSLLIGFTLNMRRCQVTSLYTNALVDLDNPVQTDWSTTYNHIIWTPIKKFDYLPWTESGGNNFYNSESTCGYTINYSVQWRTYYDTVIPLPSGLITWNDAGHATSGSWFHVQSDAVLDVTTRRQTYQIELTGTIDVAEMDPPYSQTQTFELTVTDECPGDLLTFRDSDFMTWTYYIGENTEDDCANVIVLGGADRPCTSWQYNASKPVDKFFQTTWTTSVPYCPLSFEIVRDYDGTDGVDNFEALKESEGSHISLVNEMVITRPTDTWIEQFPTMTHPFNYDDPNVQLKIRTSDMSIDRQTWYLGVKRNTDKSTATQDPDEQIQKIQLNFVDVCWHIPIDNAEADSATYTMDLWDYADITYSGSTIQSSLGWPTPTTYCGGGFTHQVMYVSGDNPDLSVTQDDMDAIFVPDTDGTFSQFILTDLDWVGTHTFKIRTKVGTVGGQMYYDEDDAAWRNYQDSADFTLTVVNPCLRGIFRHPILSTSDPYVIEAREMGGQVTLQYEIPPDGASYLLGPNVGVDMYSLCGPRSHYLQLSDSSGVADTLVDIGPQSNSQNIITVADWLEFQYYPNGDPSAIKQPSYPPVYQIRVNSTNIEDQGAHAIILRWEFDQYPSADANTITWPVTAQIEFCLVESWVAPNNFEAYFPIGTKPITLQYVFQQYPCSYTATYSSKVVEISGVPQRDTTTPSFIKMDSSSGFMTVYTTDYDDLGWYVVEVTSTLDVINLLGNLDEPETEFLNTFLYDRAGNKINDSSNPPQGFVYETTFNITMGIIQINETSITDNNTAPYFLPPPDREIKIIAGLDFEYQFGEVYDWEENDVTVKVDLRNAEKIVDFDYVNLVLSIPGERTSVQTQPVFDIKITLTDNHDTDPLSRTYDLVLIIVKDWKDPVIKILEQARKEEVFYEFENRVYDLTETSVDELTASGTSSDFFVPEYSLSQNATDLLKDELDEIENPKPAPTIESFTNDGIATLRFNTPMKVPDLDTILDSKVALRITRAVNSDEVGEIGSEQFLTESGVGNFEIRDAIEVNMAPSDETENPIPIDFSWEIIEFTELYAKIQLVYDVPESVSSSSSDSDNVIITFWAGDLFEAENGKQIRTGFTISAPVIRQVSIDDAEKYRDIGRYTGYLFLGVMIVAFLAALKVNADTFAIWACYDALVLISHLPLLNISYSGRVAIMLAEIAKVLRFDFVPVDEWLKDSVDTGKENAALDIIFQQNGYRYSSIVLNLSSFMGIFVILILANVAAALLDCSRTTIPKTPEPNGRTQVREISKVQEAMNCFVRFMMISFFEVFICLLVNFKKSDPDREGDFEKISFIVSIFFLVLFSLFIGLLFVLTATESDPERDQDEPPMLPLQTIYLNTANKKRTQTNIYLISFMLRRAIFAVVAVLMQDYPALQLLIMMLTSWITSAIVLRGNFYQDSVSRRTIKWLEYLFSYICAISLIFSPEYKWRSFDITDDMATTICILTMLVAISSVCLMLYSLCWQVAFNKRRIQNMIAAIQMKKMKEQLRQEKSQKQVLDVVVEVDEESARSDRRNKRDQRRQQALRDKIAHGVITPAQIEAEQEQSDDELAELERLAGIGKLEISDDEDYPPIQDGVSDARPNSVGEESSYSDFMKQWKSKLNEGEDKNVPDDAVSNHSGTKSVNSATKSAYSAKNEKIAQESPFQNLSKQQTLNLLVGDQTPTIIPEANEDTDSDEEGVILSKTEQRRMKLLGNSGFGSSASLLPAIAELPDAHGTNYSAFDGLVAELDKQGQDVEAPKAEASDAGTVVEANENQVVAEETLPVKPSTPAGSNNEDDEYELL